MLIKFHKLLTVAAIFILTACETVSVPEDSVSTEAIDKITGDEVISIITYVSPKVVDPVMVHSGTGGIIEFAMLASMQSRESISDVIYRMGLDDPSHQLSRKIQQGLQQEGFNTVHRKVRQPLPLTESFEPYQRAFPGELVLEIAVPGFSFRYNGFTKSYTGIHKSLARLINVDSQEVLFVTSCDRKSATVNEKQFVENDAEILRAELSAILEQCAEQLIQAADINLKVFR